MIIKTYCKNIDIPFKTMKFDFDRALISLASSMREEKLFFCSRGAAREAYFKIIEGLEANFEVVDLTEFLIAYGSLNIQTARETLTSTKNHYENNHTRKDNQS